MIEFRGLHKRYGKLQVLRGIDLTVRAGRITGLVGPNSAGKTTLIKSLLGHVRPERGEILVDGVPIDAEGKYRARIGYMPQIARFPENLSGAELIAMLCGLRRDTPGLPARPLDEELVARFGLGPHLGKPLRTLSGGTRQKINAVLAFLFTPDLLVLDEPSAGLDPGASGTHKDTVLAARAAGRTVLVTSHVLAESPDRRVSGFFNRESRTAPERPATREAAGAGGARPSR